MYSPSFLQKFYRFSSYTKFYDPFWVDIHVGDVRSRSGFIYLFFACEYPAVPASFVEKTILSPLTCFISGLLNFIPLIYWLLHTFSNFCLECLICHFHLTNFYSKPKACFSSADLVHNSAYLEHSAHRIFVIVCVYIYIYNYMSFSS